MTRLIRSVIYSLTALLFASQAYAADLSARGGSNVWMETFQKYGMNFMWIIVSTLGFSIALGLGLKIFDLFSRGIDESEELKKRNYGVAIIFSVFIFMVAILVTKVIKSY